MFKDRKNINQRTEDICDVNLKDLADAVKKYGLRSNELLLCLLSGAKQEDTDHCPNHNGCSYINDKRPANEIPVTEKRICRCMYYLNRDGSTERQRAKCEKCNFPAKRKNAGNYTVLDYEVPMPKVVNGVGGIDLLVQSPDAKSFYAVEVKPDDSDETLVRMIAEILTYCEISNYSVKNNGRDLPVVPAICFFENSRQWDDYIKLESNTDLSYLLSKVKTLYISVDGDTFEIHDAEIEPIAGGVQNGTDR